MIRLSKEIEEEIDFCVKMQNHLEETLAIRNYGKAFEELDYDEKEEVMFEVQDILGIGR